MIPGALKDDEKSPCRVRKFGFDPGPVFVVSRVRRTSHDRPAISHCPRAAVLAAEARLGRRKWECDWCDWPKDAAKTVGPCRQVGRQEVTVLRMRRAVVHEDEAQDQSERSRSACRQSDWNSKKSSTPANRKGQITRQRQWQDRRAAKKYRVAHKKRPELCVTITERIGLLYWEKNQFAHL